MPRLPALFISHGAPSVLLDGSPAPAAWRVLAARLPRPRGIVLMSAHHPAATAQVGHADAWSTWHDFGGFPEPLYQLQYPAHGDAALAQRVLALLHGAGIAAQPDASPKLDHGAWVPLLAMYPEAEIPLVRVAVQPRASAEVHWQLGHALRELADDGVLVIGSGSYSHNLGELVWGEAQPPAWASDFCEWMSARLAAQDLPAVLAWEAQAPEARRNHPTPEHLLPLFFVLGAGGWPAEPLYQAYEHGALGMQLFGFGAALPA